jgi:4-hydroxy-tetrahydrodipicolinate synthase
LPAPILLYNLPQFTSGLETETIVRLLQRIENVVGIKDSSGTVTVLRTLTQTGIEASRIVGNDGVLAQALDESACDGVISGVACVLPEVIQALFASRPGSGDFRAAGRQLSEFIAQVDVLPTPWGLKVIAEARGIAPAVYHQPVSAQRVKQIKQIVSWFEEWMQKFVEA